MPAALEHRGGTGTMAGLIDGAATLLDAATGQRLTGAGLHAAVAPLVRAYDRLPAGPVFSRAATTLPSVLRYLAAGQAGRPVALLDPALPAAELLRWVARFRPAAVIGLDEPPAIGPVERPAGYADLISDATGSGWRRTGGTAVPPHPELGLLLATSGSTGEPRLVRLSRAAVRANAQAITEALRIDDREVAPTNLPLFYSYGLSVLNSHLLAGATVVVVAGGLLSRPFWSACHEYGVTSLAGVTRHYDILERIRWRPADLPRLRTLTHAGGALDPPVARRFHDRLSAAGGRLYLMYGQTEATARIAVLPPQQLTERVGSAGRAVPGGSLAIRRRVDTGEQEIVYRGPNVMMGYADRESDLGRGDDLRGELATGDLGRLDPDGFLYVTGRGSRTAKVFGVRVNLDHVERAVGAAGWGPVAALAGADRVVLWCSGATADQAAAAPRRLGDLFRVHPSGFDVRPIDRLPGLPSGKTDYAALRALTDEAPA